MPSRLKFPGLSGLRLHWRGWANGYTAESVIEICCSWQYGPDSRRWHSSTVWAYGSWALGLTAEASNGLLRIGRSPNVRPICRWPSAVRRLGPAIPVGSPAVWTDPARPGRAALLSRPSRMLAYRWLISLLAGKYPCGWMLPRSTEVKRQRPFRPVSWNRHPLAFQNRRSL